MLGGIHGDDEAKVNKELHKALAVDALRLGESMNSYCVGLLREEMSHYGEKKRR